MAKEDYNCIHRLRVRWSEVDMQKVVFNGHYLTYIDTAFADASPAPLITAELVYVNADPATMKAAPLPEDMRTRVRRYERTAPAEA